MLLQSVLCLSLSYCLAQYMEPAHLVDRGDGPIRFMNFANTEGYSLMSHVTASYQVPDDVDCAFKCVMNSSCVSFNYGGEKKNDLYMCELNNSDKFVHPENFTSRQGFLYGGVNAPCFSAPCVNGGTCIETENSFTCKCALAIRVLPYTDGRCSVDNSLIVTTSSYVGVFGARAAGQYKLNFYEAQRLCEILQGNLASYEQLYQAWEAGMEMCSWSWLNDATVRYPMQQAKHQCSTKREIKGTTTPLDKTKTKNALCFKP